MITCNTKQTLLCLKLLNSYQIRYAYDHDLFDKQFESFS